MGMFDYLRCDYPLPCADPAHAAKGDYQTKDTPHQLLSRYRLRADGTLWCEAWCEGGAWTPEDEPPPQQLHDFTGQVDFYTFKHDAPPGRISPASEGGWLEFRAVFVKGQLAHVELIEDRDGERQ